MGLTPMLIQYLEIKRAHADCILFYRMGDFYEMFYEDAVKAAPVLDVQLTSRDRNSPDPIPMCGVPFHAATGYIQKLVSNGFKVALCEQMEEASATKGLVWREVVRIVTPSLVGDPEMVSDESQNLLVCLSEKESTYEICAFDLLAGEARSGVVSNLKGVIEVFSQLSPREILIADDKVEWLGEITTRFPNLMVTSRQHYFGKSLPETLRDYLRETQKLEQGIPLRVLPLFEPDTLQLDSTSATALGIAPNNFTREGHPTILHSCKKKKTAMGRRLLREWLLKPSCRKESVELRLEAVENFFNNVALCEELAKILSSIRDLERLTTKTQLGLSLPRDIVAIREVQKQIPSIMQLLSRTKSSRLQTLHDTFDSLQELTLLLENALAENPPAVYRDGNIFRDGYSSEIDEYRTLSHDAKSTIAAMESRERERTGINSLKIKYSKVFGYTIEITKSHLTKVPEDYIRKQTIAGGERYITEELKSFEQKALSADSKLKSLEEMLFLDLRSKVASAAQSLMSNARILGEIDVLCSFALIARERGFVKPRLNSNWDLEIIDGRHPVVEALLPAGAFVPNTITFSKNECSTVIITGPNMAGKSTIMRQVALISLMAQAGSFVPAKSANLPLVDAIYTRIGSADDLAQGRSTFMVEMIEVARILSRATDRSLILIDEIGRGTSTYDGLSLAWSLLEHIHTELRCKTLFATHFHEITALEKALPGVKNMNVLVEKWKEGIVFLHKLGPGICAKSYGIEVARLADLPSKLLIRAREILDHLESQSQRASAARGRALHIHDNQMDLFAPPESMENRVPLET